MQHDGIRVVEILCWVGVAHMNGDSEVGAMFGVEQFDKCGSQLVAKIVRVDVQIRVMFVTDERHLIDCAVHCI